MTLANVGLPSHILRPAVVDVSGGAAYTAVQLTDVNPNVPGGYNQGKTASVEVFNPNGAGNLRVAITSRAGASVANGGGTQYRTVPAGTAWQFRIEAAEDAGIPTVWIGGDAGGLVAEVTYGIAN